MKTPNQHWDKDNHQGDQRKQIKSQSRIYFRVQMMKWSHTQVDHNKLMVVIHQGARTWWPVLFWICYQKIQMDFAHPGQLATKNITTRSKISIRKSEPTKRRDLSLSSCSSKKRWEYSHHHHTLCIWRLDIEDKLGENSQMYKEDPTKSKHSKNSRSIWTNSKPNGHGDQDEDYKEGCIHKVPG